MDKDRINFSENEVWRDLLTNLLFPFLAEPKHQLLIYFCHLFVVIMQSNL